MPKVTPSPLSKGSGLPATVLPSKVAGKARALPPSSGYESGQRLRQDRSISPNQSIQDLRRETNASTLMRQLVDVDGLMSTAVVQLVSMADSGLSILAYETFTNEFSRAGLLAAETIMSALNTTWDYSKGYSDRRSVPSLVETALLEVALTGGIGAELVLDSLRLPRAIELFPYDQVYWLADGKGGKYPSQRPSVGDIVELNYPTIFIGEALKPAKKNYTIPFIASGASRLFQLDGFYEDMIRVVRRSGEPRLVLTLDYDAVVASAPPEILGDSEKLRTYLEQARSSVETTVSGLAPEDVLVVYSQVGHDSISAAGEKRDFKELLEGLTNQAASAIKSNSSMLGMRSGGSQNVAGVEAVLSTKMARRLQIPVEEVLSRALTLAIRLYGVDAYVDVKFRPINLRPEDELESHRAVRQNRVLELLSLGRITDDEAQVALGLGSMPSGAPELSGTGFYNSKAPDTTPVSGTNAQNASATGSAKTSAGGKDNAQRPSSK